MEMSGEWHLALLEQSLAGIYLIQDGFFHYVNQEFARIFGFQSPDEIIGKVPIIELIAPEDRDKVVANVRRRSGGEVTEMRYSFIGIQRDGKRIDLEVHGRAMEFRGKPAVIGVALDITARKLAETAADAKLSALFEHSPLGIALVDMDGHHLEYNRAYQQLLNSSEDTLKTTDMWSCIAEEYASEKAAMRKALETEGRYSAIELNMYRENGQTVPVQAFGVRIVGADNRHYVWSIVDDITRRKTLELETKEQLKALESLYRRLQDTHAQLLQAEKMSAVGMLAAGVAHEINNPVGYVKSNIKTLTSYVSDLLQLISTHKEMLNSCADDDSPAREKIRAVEVSIDFDFIHEDAPKLLQESLEGIERVRHIVSDLRDFSKVGSAEWQLADLNKCINSTLNVLDNNLKQKVDIDRQFGQLPKIHCNPSQLNQVFMNLLINAAQAIPERGRITIRTGHKGDSVWVEIEDTGVGIAEENLSRIFEPFFTTRSVGDGTGLGLSVSYGIIRNHQGDIQVSSIVGSGSTFHISLPISPDDEHTDK
ncbi:signal transduction histidine kinase regulating C4-dicarboxylate transport system [Gynuella sunshinyii YC6258]|uniref:histidine kinase n=2 Tax=Gynuella sunshinyii TaxID=1445505 RepID=A0A0C5VTN5_9GAMM|nr:signal transduction histidine kinase regulating C4-dicarboxylate transport system [Gynuella sunshinyii YC6258]